jgi:uncharacterized protein (TIGR03435 family)
MKKTAILASLALWPALAQPPSAPQPKFELADVHVSPTAFWFAQNTGGQIRPGLISNGLYIYRDATVLNLIQAAYGITEDMVSGGPSWLKSDLFDVVAKVPAGTTPESLKIMLQSLLADRFALKTDTESKPSPRYVLAVGKAKPKMKPAAAAGGDPTCKQDRLQPVVGPDGLPSLPNMKASCSNMTTQDIAGTLKQMAGGYTTYLDHDIVDSTNLEGKWDFDLEWTPPGAVNKDRDGSITIFDAVSKQLGLTLELHDVPVPVRVVKSVNRKPTPNAPEVATALVIPPPSFEAAVVKPLEPNQGRAGGATGGSQFKAAGTLRMLVAAAFQIQPNASRDEIIGLPKFADSQLWDITAKFPSTGEGSPYVTGGRTIPPTQSILLKMIQDLLADQFELKTHTEKREITVYALTVEGKHKLTRADPSERSDCRPDPNAPKPFPNIGAMANCKNITMADFARNLEQATGFFDHPIVDETGLEGGWDFLLGFSRQTPQRPAAPNQAATSQQAALPDVDEGMSAYDAVQKELGLKLVKSKRSVDVIVVDHVDEKPVQ